MDPRRLKTLTTSTPSVANPSATFGLASEASDPSTISGSSFVGKIAVKRDDVFPKMTTLDWVLKAIETVGVPRKGASYIAILKWIVNNKENVMINRLKTNLRTAIEKALENGLIKRPATSKNVTGLRGYFIKNRNAVTVQKIPKTKPARKLVEITNATKIMKTAAAKTKASAQLKSKAENSTKPIKLLTKPSKPNRDGDAAGISSKPKTQLKSRAEKPKTDAVEGKTKTHSKEKSAKQTSSKPKIQHKSVKPNPNAEAGPSYKPETQPKNKNAKANPEAEAGPSNKHKTQPKSKAAKPNLDVIAEPSTKSKTRAKARTTKPKVDTEAGPSNKPKAQPKYKAKEPNINAVAEPSAKPKTRANVRTAKPNLDAKDEPKTQPESTCFEFNLDVETRPKTRPKTRVAKANLDAEAGPKTLPKSTAFEINLDTEPGSETEHKVSATEPNPDTEAGPESHPKATGNEPKPEAGHSSLLKTPPKTKAAVKPRPGKLPLKDILPHKKAASKTSKTSQKLNPKKLYKPSGELPLNISREEFYDKVSNVKPKRSNVRFYRRNSYASDSEVICNTKVAKATKMTKNFEVKKVNKKETSEAGPSVSSANERRGKNNSADV